MLKCSKIAFYRSNIEHTFWFHWVCMGKDMYVYMYMYRALFDTVTNRLPSISIHFWQMRYTEKVSVWPVGFAGHVKVESPVCKEGKVVGFHTGFKGKSFVEMAGWLCKKLPLWTSANFWQCSQRGWLYSDQCLHTRNWRKPWLGWNVNKYVLANYTLMYIHPSHCIDAEKHYPNNL